MSSTVRGRPTRWSEEVAASARAARHWIDLAAMRGFLARAGLARQSFPEHLVVVDDLPRVPSGKISKDALRARQGDCR